MATVPNLPLALSQVRAVFGAPAGTPLHNFVRGGPWVPNIAANNNVPTAPPIRLAQLVGATNYQNLTISVPNAYGSGPASDGFAQTSPPTTASITGGNGSPSFHWTYISGSVAVLCDSPNNQTTVFHQIGMSSIDRTYNAVWRCTVSDGISSAYGDCSITIERMGGI